MATGTVKWFDPDKGYGFIAIDGGRDIFFKASAIMTDGYQMVEEGQRVEFKIEKHPHQEMHAERVVVIGLSPSRDIV